jgi:hypothetical protein
MTTRKSTNLPHTVLPVAHEWQQASNLGNWDRQRNPIKYIVMHTMVGNVQGTTAKFGNPEKRSSAHYGIGTDGQIYQWVAEDLTAYHATKLAVNRESIGIEHEDKGKYNDPRPDALYRTSALLVRDICLFYGLPIDSTTIIRHKDVAATACPDALDVERVIREANALGATVAMPSAPNPVPPPGSNLQISLEEYRAIQFLKEQFPQLKADNGQPFGSLEGMLRSMVDTYKTYTNLIKPTQDGKPSVVLPGGLFADLSIKAKHLDTLADSLGYPMETRVESNFGAILVKLYQNGIVKTQSNLEASVALLQDPSRETISNNNPTFAVNGTQPSGVPQTATPLKKPQDQGNLSNSSAPKTAIRRFIELFLKEV